MGRGDKKSKKGKIFKGSFGVSRPRKTDKATIFPTKKKDEKKEKAVKKTTTKKKAATKKKVTKKTSTKKKATTQKK